MITLKTTRALAEFCDCAATQAYVTIDTEFLRERSYFSKLCLIQLAIPGGGPGDAVLVDVLEGDVDLAPLYALFRNPDVVKVFHAARQDLEIFWFDGGVFPQPFFDTQVAAMVCGFGEQVGYETLVRKLTGNAVDKSSRFTDWSRRPLSDRQKAYALADVTHLRDVYEILSRKISEAGRKKWVEEEISVLTRAETYEIDPAEAWRRVKTRSNSGKFLALVRELARFRENHARSRNIPRSRVFKDEALLELASSKPRTAADLGKSRLLMREARRGEIAAGILGAIETALACDPADYPKPPKTPLRKQGHEGLADLLRVLLKAKAGKAGVAQKLIASSVDLDDIAAGELEVRALHGWRHEIFGKDALRLCQGKVALSANGSSVRIVDIS